jgi:nitrous oxide reductase accessory protein NosL
MKKLSTFLLLFISIIFFIGCEKENDNGLAKMHWDRDMCERCVMVVSEKSYAVQIQNPTTKQIHKFDDIGCAILWFEETNKNWFDQADIWVKDEKSHEWIDAKSAMWTFGNITPMNYGVAAYTKETFPKEKNNLSFKEAIELIHKQDKEDKLRRKHKLHNKG